MQSVLSRSIFRSIHNIRNNVSAARIYCSLTSPQFAVTTAVFTRPRYFASGPEGHIRDTDSTFSFLSNDIDLLFCQSTEQLSSSFFLRSAGLCALGVVDPVAEVAVAAPDG